MKRWVFDQILTLVISPNLRLQTQGHFDGVIRKFREARITDSQWSRIGDTHLDNILGKLRSLFPNPVPLQFQVLHLASEGEILPHVDNVDASGSVIMGVSLGSSRILRLEDENGSHWEQLLEPGSCYIQRYVRLSVMFSATHTILYLPQRCGSLPI